MNKRMSRLALLDIQQGIRSWHTWLLLGVQDIRLRYRRSVIGPFWITLSMAIMIYTMGFLYGKLFKVDLSIYYPYLAAGIITWTLIATTITESVEAFFQSANYILQSKLPYSTYILRIVTRNFIIFLHNLLTLLPILIIFKVKISFLILPLLFFNMALIFICGFCYAYIIAIVGTRYQDVKQIIVSLTQIFFLLTPIMWMPSMLPERFGLFAELNPFYQLINLMRQPLTGHLPEVFTYVYTFSLLATGFIVLFLLLRRTRHRIAFWI